MKSLRKRHLSEREIWEIGAKRHLTKYPDIALMTERLARKAAAGPKFRFYRLFWWITHEQTLRCAWERVRANGISAGRSPLRVAKSLERCAPGVDVSGSMDALDLTPKGEKYSRETTRFAVVKKLFAKFVEKRPDDLIGLITFGGYAATRSPLTADHEALLNVLKGVEILSIALDAQGQPISREEQMTAIGDGLATALARLKDAKPKSKIVILLSDGVSNTGAVEPDEAAAAAAKLGIKVYAIGVGTRARRTPIFGKDFFGRTTIQYADMTFDEKQLKSIAKKTGGTYFPVNDKNGLEKALEEIDQLETTKLEADAYNRWQEHFTLFLLVGALLVFVAVSLSMSATRRMA